MDRTWEARKIVFPSRFPLNAVARNPSRLVGRGGMEQLVQVVAPHFVAGLIMKDLTCVEAAPILRWAINKDRDFLRVYFARKNWKASIVQ